MLQPMVSHRVRHNLATEQQQTMPHISYVVGIVLSAFHYLI